MAISMRTPMPRLLTRLTPETHTANAQEDPVTDTLNLAVIGGDGIGPEVVAEGLKVLEVATAGSGLKVSTTEYDLGARRWHATGETLPSSVLEELKEQDAILLGAIGDPSVPSGVLERGVLLPIRFALEHYVNLRPAKLFPGVRSPLDVDRVAPDGIDFVVVREGTEGPYVGNGGSLRTGTPNEIATEVSVNTRFGVERVVRDAFARAQARPRKHLTLVHKHNVLTYAGHLWRRTVEEVGTEFADVDTAYQHVDAATIFLTTDPGRFDVIVTDNLFGDIVTDIAGAIVGGIGLAASGNINPERAYPSMFEPVHGSAPDIAGQAKADPTATILSVALLLEHLGRVEQARAVEAAVAADLAERGEGTRSTTAVGDGIAARLA
jgi:3-isopropylmalate dehydrogenase